VRASFSIALGIGYLNTFVSLNGSVVIEAIKSVSFVGSALISTLFFYNILSNSQQRKLTLLFVAVDLIRLNTGWPIVFVMLCFESYLSISRL